MANKAPSGNLPIRNQVVDITIDVGETVSSDAVDATGYIINGFIFPANFTATSVTFLGSIDGVNFKTMKDLRTGSALTGIVAAGDYSVTPPSDFSGTRFIKIEGNTSQLSSAATIQVIVSRC